MIIGEITQEWNIFRRYFIDPDYGLSRNRLIFPCQKKRTNPGAAGLPRIRVS
jgi:hypothetical protein